MRFLSKTHDCDAFFLCAGWKAADYTYSHGNNNIVHQALYCQAGDTIINNDPYSETKFKQFLPTPNVPVVYKPYGSVDGVFVAIAHKLNDSVFTLEPLHSGSTKVVVGGSGECYVACLDGSIVANTKTIDEFKFARVSQGQEVSVSVPDGSFGLVLTR
jgi:hypothetical protein